MKTLEKTALDLIGDDTPAEQFTPGYLALIEKEKKKKAEDAADIARQLRNDVDDFLAAGVTPERMAVESGAKLPGLRAWLNGDGGESVIPALLAWREEIERDAKEMNGGFVMTPSAREIIKAFDRARAPKNNDGDRGIALVYGASGVGKTKTAQWYASRPGNHGNGYSAPVVVVHCTGRERSAEAVLTAVLERIGRDTLYRQSHKNKLNSIREVVPVGGIIIFDDAHLLPLPRLDSLRSIFPEQLRIALAFIGNLTGYKELTDAKIAQIMSRAGGARVVVDKPGEGDVDALLAAADIAGRKVREAAQLIGMQDGGLRMLADTITAAHRLARASGKAIDVDLLKYAAVSVGAWGAGT